MFAVIDTVWSIGLASLALLMFLIWFPLRPDVLALLPNASTSRRNRYVACSQRILSTFFQQHITFWHVFYGRADFWTCVVALHRKGPSLSFSRPKVFSPPSLGLSPFGLLFSRRVAFAAHCFWGVSLIALHPGGCRSVICIKRPFLVLAPCSPALRSLAFGFRFSHHFNESEAVLLDNCDRRENIIGDWKFRNNNQNFPLVTRSPSYSGSAMSWGKNCEA